MNKVQSIELNESDKKNDVDFDAKCKKATAVIAGLLCALIALAFADRAELLPWLGFIVIFMGDLCACAVLTLYFGMAVHALFRKQKRSQRMAYVIAGALSEALKLIFLLLPTVIYGGASVLPQFLALITDIVLSVILGLKSAE